MPLNDTIRSIAENNGVQQQFWDIYGQPHNTTDATNRAVLQVLGFDCSSEAALAASVERSAQSSHHGPFPPAMVTSESGPAQFPFDVQITLENGERRHLPAGHPANLPLGYHEVTANGASMRLIVAPDSAHRVAPGRHAGFGITLYGVRSRRNWGCGDFRDLTDLVQWAARDLHADFIALNPLHAIHNRRPYNASPYLPNSIFYRNFLYLDVEGVCGYEAIRSTFETAELRAILDNLRNSETVEYEAIAALKRSALEQIFELVPPPPACAEWIKGEGALLRLYSTYCALDEHLHSQDPNLWVWPEWPERFRDCASPAVSEFAAAHEREILFHGWLQWLIDIQLAEVQRGAHAAGMKIGLYHDLALATDRCGSDLWAHRAFFANGARVGSPPDGFSPAGQDWSFPPPNQRKHLEDGYRLFAESIRKSMRHGGALRIDHVMRLFRLYWIPEGHTAAEGAYVRDKSSDMVRILALESVRNQAVIVGEDLGTVEDEVREILARFGILSYRLLIFEQDEKGFKPPQEYPEQALVSTTTHDLPTMAGFWTGEDIEARLRAGTIDERSRDQQKWDRVRDKQRLLDAFFSVNLLPPDFERDAGRIPHFTPELQSAALGYLASTPSSLWLVNQEDMTGETLQQNLPGTTSEYPNWSRKMRWSLEDLAGERSQMVAAWVQRSGRSR